MRIRRFLLCALTIIMLISTTGISAMATESDKQINSGTTIEIFSLIPQGLELGETKAVYSDENGTMYVTLESSEQLKERGTAMGIADQYKFTYKNLLGQTKDAFGVNVICKWMKDGINSSITSFSASYLPIANSFVGYWVDSTTTPTNCSRMLSMTHNATSTVYYTFSATVKTSPTNPDVRLAWSTN